MLNTKPVNKMKNNNTLTGGHVFSSQEKLKEVPHNDSNSKDVTLLSSKQQLENIISKQSDNHSNNSNNSNNSKYNKIQTFSKINVEDDKHNFNSYDEVEKNSQDNFKFYSDEDNKAADKLVINNINKNKVQQRRIINNEQNQDKYFVFNDEDNSYVAINNSNNECVITNNNIIEYIFNVSSSVGINIKKYIFIISKNELTSNYEFNFINTIFTNNLDMMIKLQNFLYETLNNYNISEDNNLNKIASEKLEILLLFYYQLIIWLFKNYSQYEHKYESNKIIKFFSSLTYRFSILVLKNILKIKNDLSENKYQLNEVIKLKDNLLNEMDNKDKPSYESDDEKSSSSDASSNNTNDEITTNIDFISSSINKESSINVNDDVSSNIYDKINIQKNGKKISKINELFSDENKQIINDTVEFDKKSLNSNSNLISEMIKIKEKQNKKLSDISEIESSFISSQTPAYSFNSKSAEKNSKIYNIDI